MLDLTRDALIETADAAITGAYHHTVDWQTPAAAGAVDAVLTALADDLDRKADSDHDMNCSCEKCIEQTGVLIAAHRLRSLLPSTEGDQP